MKRIRIIILFTLFCTCIRVYAQLSTKERPISFDSKIKLTEISKNSISAVTMPKLDMAKVEAEDKENEEYDMPPRFGFPHKVNYDLNHSGIWYELPNGDKLWKLNIICPDALSVNICYDKFWIPEGGKFFVYSKDRMQYIGAFTSKNNKGDQNHIRGFATGLIYDSDIVLEYYQPKDVEMDAIISIDFIVHGYKNIKAGNGSLPCMVNINCDDGQNWQNEKKAVARMIIEGAYYGSGSLINTTKFCQEPFFLTASHCVTYVGKDAVGYPNLDYTLFYWNYEAPGCDNIIGEPTNSFVTSGATILSNNPISDFALLRLTEDPNDISNYTPYYLGWDRSGQSGNSGVCIHHPMGDVKKISTVASQPTSASNHWKVEWSHGITQGGASGSPLLNAEHRIVGQLQGADTTACYYPYVHGFFGKFHVSWTGNGNNSIQRRLDCWIDSLNAGVQTMEGLLIIPVTKTITTNEQIYSNIRITSSGKLTIQSNVELVGNCRVIVESGGQLIIDGGALLNADIFLKSGSSLRIINNGVIEIANCIDTAVGASVDILYGQILNQ